MPTFPDGSSVWITDVSANKYEEYEEYVEADVPLKHKRSVYIAAEKGEFVVWYNMGKSEEECRRLDIRVDGQFAQGFRIQKHIYEQPLKCEGWLLDSTTVKRFAFGAIDTIQEGDGGDGAERSAHRQAFIEVRWCDAVLQRDVRKEVPELKGTPRVAAPVHPDSKACVVGCQVKPGSTKVLSTALSYSKHRSVRKEGSVEYIARFFYNRPKQLLLADAIVPDEAQPDVQRNANVADANPSSKKRKCADVPELQDSDELPLEAAAIHVSDALPQEAALKQASDDAAEPSVAEQRRKRLMTDLLAMQQEHGADTILDALLATRESVSRVKTELDSKAAVKHEPSPGHRTSSDPVPIEPRLKNRKIFIDLSAADRD